MKKAALKTYGKIIAGLLSFLGMIFGFNNCTGESPVEYGTPSADYIIKGTVSNTTDSTPIEGIQVTVISESVYKPDTAYTDKDGDYELSMENTLLNSVKIVATDTHTNLEKYKSDTIQVVFTSNDKKEKGSGNWDWGTYEKDRQNFSLKQR